MNIFLFLIACAVVVGSQAIEDEPKINFGICDPELENFDASDILSFYNDPENADFKELLRALRYIYENYKFYEKGQEKRIRELTEMLFGKNEISNQLSEVMKTRREYNIHLMLCTINIIFGDKETRGPFTPQLEDFQELFRKLRDIIKNREFDAEIIRDILEESFDIEMDDQFYEVFKITGEIGKPMLLYFINVYILEEETQGNDAPPLADIRKPLGKLRDLIKNYKIDEEKIQDYIEMEYGKSEISHYFSELIKITGEMGKQRLSNFINIYLGYKETLVDCASQNAVFNELKKLRDRIQNSKFDEGNFFRDLMEKVLGNSETANHLHELLKTSGKSGKQWIVDLINKILESQETQGTCIVPIDDTTQNWHIDSESGNILSYLRVLYSYTAGLKKRFENLINRMKHNLDSGGGIGELYLLMKKATAVYETFQELELDDDILQLFDDLSKLDRSSSLKTEEEEEEARAWPKM